LLVEKPTLRIDYRRHAGNEPRASGSRQVEASVIFAPCTIMVAC
jgi:hypothetical protein